MHLVVTHEQPDFDALGSVALATVLYPGAVGALEGHLGSAVAEVLRLFRDLVPLVDPDRVDLDDVTALVVVDTADRTRLGRFAELVDRVPVTVFDHHPEPTEPVPSGLGLREQMGATVTLLARRLQTEGVTLPPPIASLALLGLHEDTGDLTYAHVRSDDHRAAAWLLDQGANLDLVRRFRSVDMPPELREARDRVLEDATVHVIRGRRVAVGRLEGDGYRDGASAIAGDLLGAVDADAALVVATMEGKTVVFARSGPRVDVGSALQRALGGGGHARAAFARTSLTPDEALAKLLAALPACVTPPIRARDVMSSPVVTVAQTARVAEARQTLARHAHNGMPVLDEAGRLVGVISRRDLDHALRHDIGDAAVSGFMTRPAITADADATLDHLEGIVLSHDVGRVPIVEGDELVGIVTRTDLVRARHPRPAPHAPADRVWASLPDGAREVLEVAAELAGPARLHLVGGTVRDGLLGVGYVDLDVVVEGRASGGVADGGPDSPAAVLGRALADRLGGTLTQHETFGTASLALAHGLVIDLASARAEDYGYPGALPVVREGDLTADLARRDFTVNALAVRVHPRPRELRDPFGGLADLEARRLRVLHPLSFVEDPTRLVRGARLAGRLGLRFDDDAAAKARASLRPAVVANVSGQRLRAELELTLAETRVTPALRHLAALGALEGLYGLRWDEAATTRLDEERGERARRGERAEGDDTAALLVLLASTSDAGADAAVARFHWPKRLATQRAKLRAALATPPPLGDALLRALEPAARRALAALAPVHAAAVKAFEHAPPEPRLRGRDVLTLGLAPGPAVGDVLAEVDHARAAGDVRGFDDELALARHLVAQRATREVPATAPIDAHPPEADA